MTNTCGSCFNVGTEFCDEETTTVGLLPFETTQSITKTFRLAKGTPVTIGTQCLEYFLTWTDERFTCGNGRANFAVVDVCNGAQPCSGSEIIAQLTASPLDLEGQCYTDVTLFALPV